MSKCTRARQGSERKLGHEPDKKGLNTEIHLAVDANGMPVRVLITNGASADCKEAYHLIESIDAKALFADRAAIPTQLLLLRYRRARKSLFGKKCFRAFEAAVENRCAPR